MKMQKLYILITIVITLYLLNGCSSQPVIENTLATVDPAVISIEKAKASELFAQREDPDKLRQAISLLAKLRNPNSRDYEVEWTFAKYNYFLGKHTTDNKEAESVFEKGIEAGKIASRIQPQKPDGYFWYGANLGELSKLSPITVGLRSVDDVRDAMNKVIEIQPTYQGASAYDALGQVELATRVKGGSAEKAVEYLEKAISLEKNNTNLRLHLAEAYLAINMDGEARKQLQILLQMKADPEYVPEYKECIEKGKKLLADKF